MIADAERRLLRISVSASDPMDWVHGSTGSDWLDENCEGNGWAMKKAALEQSASDAARRLFPSEGLRLGDLRHQAHLDHGYPSVNKPSSWT